MRWEERRTGQTKFFWHEAFRNSGFDKMPWEVNFGRLEAETDTNRKTQIRVSASVLANTYRRETTFYVLPQVECADARRDNNSLSSQSLLLSRERALASLHSIVPFLLWASQP